jgi:hypothetical protein
MLFTLQVFSFASLPIFPGSSASRGKMITSIAIIKSDFEFGSSSDQPQTYQPINQ